MWYHKLAWTQRPENNYNNDFILETNVRYHETRYVAQQNTSIGYAFCTGLLYVHFMYTICILYVHWVACCFVMLLWLCWPMAISYTCAISGIDNRLLMSDSHVCSSAKLLHSFAPDKNAPFLITSSSFHEFHETCHSVTLVNSHQRWKQTRNRGCFHLWCELTLALWCHSIVWSLFSWNKM